MAVSGISAGSVDPVLASAFSAQAAASEASIQLLDAALDLAKQQSAQLLSSLQSAAATGVGGQLDAYA